MLGVHCSQGGGYPHGSFEWGLREGTFREGTFLGGSARFSDVPCGPSLARFQPFLGVAVELGGSLYSGAPKRAPGVPKGAF